MSRQTQTSLTVTGTTKSGVGTAPTEAGTKVTMSSGSTARKTLLGKEYFPRNHLPPYLSASCNKNNGQYGSLYNSENSFKMEVMSDRIRGNSGGGDGDGISLSSGGTNKDGNDSGTAEGNTTSGAVLTRVQSIKSLFTSSASRRAQKISPVGPTSSDGGSPQSPNRNQRGNASPSRRGGDESISLNQSNDGALLRQTSPQRISNQSAGVSQVGPAPVTNNGHNTEVSSSSCVIPTWRLKERMKTVGVGLILALNIGTDPPDVNKPNPCAKLQCWMDPTSTSRAKAREEIGRLLESQYARWQQRAKLRYKRALDPTVEDVRNLCYSLRRSARNERILLHYNGHGVPKPTDNGEIWVFDMNHTQYIPLAVTDLKKWIEKPSLVVLDCSAAGALLPFFTSNNVPASGAPMAGGGDNLNGSLGGISYADGMGNAQAHANINSNYIGGQSNLRKKESGGIGMSNVNNMNSSNVAHNLPSMTNVNSGNNISSFNLPHQQQQQPSSSTIKPNPTEESEEAARSVQDVIVLCPTSASETLPLNPELPADLFTTCLTTPIPIALRWFVYQNPLSFSNLPADNVDLIPGDLPDRKTPLGELNWIFTAITDTIAWSVLPSPLFQRLFRQDLLVASMFRNFLLADRILRDLNCTPMSYPALPSTCDHPLWQAWDLAVETCLSCLMRDGVLGMLKDTAMVGHGAISGMSSESQAQSVSHHTAVEKERDEDNKGDTHDSEDVASKLKRTTLDNGVNGARLTEEQGGGMTSGGSKITSTNHTQRKVQGNTSIGGEIPQHASYNVSAPFFAEQLTAFEIWLEFAATRTKDGGIILNPPLNQYVTTGFDERMVPSMYENHTPTDIESPEQLPIVLQVLLSPAHRVRALMLLERFHHLGPSAVNIALSVGIFPYVLRLLQSQIDAYKHVLVGIWSKILEFDPSCQVDLVKDGALRHFIRHLQWGMPDFSVKEEYSDNATTPALDGGSDDTAYQRTMAAVILSAICHKYPPGQTECVKGNAHVVCSKLLSLVESIVDENITASQMDKRQRSAINDHLPPQFRLWICIFLGVFLKGHSLAQREAIKSEIHLRLFARLQDDSSDVRAAACFALGSLMESDPSASTMPTEMHRKSGDNSKILDNAVVSSFMTPSRGAVPFKNAISHSGYGVNSSLVHQPNSVGNITWQPQQKSRQSYGLLGKNCAMDQTAANMSVLRQSQNTVEQKQGYSLFENKRSVAQDLLILENIVKASADACPTVRYEAITVIGKAVGKYLMAFASIADKVAVVNATSRTKDQVSDSLQAFPNASTSQKSPSISTQISIPEGMDEKIENAFSSAWKRLRCVHNTDPHPGVSGAATNIVRFVNEHILVLKISLQRRPPQRRRIIESKNAEINSISLLENENEKYSTRRHDNYLRSNSAINLGLPLPSPLQRGISEGGTSEGDLPDKSLGNLNRPLRRNYSVVLGQNDINESYLYNLSPDIQGSRQWFDAQKEQCKVILQESEFYEWKKAEFKQKNVKTFCAERFRPPLDPLSREGAVQIYREQRNRRVDKEGNALAKSFISLGPKALRHPNQLENLPSILADEDEETSDAAIALEAEVASKKKALHLKQSTLLNNNGKPYMLRFHPYEDVLVACDDSDTISVWDTNNSLKVNSFKNKNPINTRMTSMLWINERNNSLLLGGCDDGSVRLWDDIIESDGAINSGKPSLSTAFFAMPELVPGQRGSSGLIVEWQELQGRLITGGSAKLIRCWDLQSEKCTNIIESNHDEYLTAMTTAWDNLGLGDTQYSTTPEGRTGMGPDILFAGYKDGTLKVFDLRSHQRTGVSQAPQSTSKRRSRISRPQQYSEHSNWIVNTSFVRYGDKYELISGCLEGGIKFWDLRNSRSIRTVDIQKSPMTALACHPRIPLFATGSASHLPLGPQALFATDSRAQYIKLFTSDGDILQVIRNHERRQGQRIGPVSCLTFHPNKLVLAAGATDGIISIHHSKGM